MALRLALPLLLVILPLVQGQQSDQSPLPPDLACAQGPRAAVWASVKQRIRTVIDTPKGPVPGPFAQVPREVLRGVLDTTLKEVQAVGGFNKEAAGECGFGKLSLQLLSLALDEDAAKSAQSLQEMESIASPALTFLLDVPWVSIALSGWPFFGILAQLSLNKVKLLEGVLDNDAVDGIVDQADREFFHASSTAQQTGDLEPMFAAAYAYLTVPPQGGAYGVATAMASQLVMQTDVQKRSKGCWDLQAAIRSVVKTPRELDLAMTTRWPLWSMLHLAVDAFAAGGGGNDEL